MRCADRAGRNDFGIGRLSDRNDGHIRSGPFGRSRVSSPWKGRCVFSQQSSISFAPSRYLLYQSNIAYFPFYQHITTYVSGILIGYLILQRAECKAAANGRPVDSVSSSPADFQPEESVFDSQARRWKLMRAIGWVLAPACSLLFMFCTFYGNNPDNYIELPNWLRISLAATQRVGWVTGIAFITFQCATGRGGPVQRLLCWPGLVPFSRLSFSIYLFHLVPIVLRAYSFHYTIPWSDYEFVSCNRQSID